MEADGRRWHTRVADFEIDRRRDNEATVHGWPVLRFTREALTSRRADVVAMLRGLRRWAA